MRFFTLGYGKKLSAGAAAAGIGLGPQPHDVCVHPELQSNTSQCHCQGRHVAASA